MSSYNDSLMQRIQEQYPFGQLLIKMPQLSFIQDELIYVFNILDKYHQHNSCKFVSELLQSISDQSFLQKNPNYAKIIQDNLQAEQQQLFFYPTEQEPSKQEQKASLHLRSLYSLKEYKKCSFYAQDCLQKINSYSECFLFYYYMSECNYLQQQLLELEYQDQKQESPLYEKINQEIQKLLPGMELENFEQILNAFSLYSKSILHSLINQKEEQIESLIQCLNKMPLHWSAWLELCKAILNSENIDHLWVLSRLPNHWIKNFFSAYIFNELIKVYPKYDQYSMGINYILWVHFKNSVYIQNQIALILHNISSYDQAVDFFVDIRSKDPFRTESMDIFSNILYVQEKTNELGKLALSCYEIDRNLPETVCILGNYYSLIGEHSKAVQCFQRSILLDKNYLSAYTLLGHEYLEMKNIASSIDSYNKALKVYNKDYRAWYGLGQVYELQNHVEFSLYYFQRATKCNPRDSWMWNALGTCYQKVCKEKEATICFEKAESLKSFEGASLFQLGSLYAMQNSQEKALYCFETLIRKKEDQQQLDKEYIDCLYLAIQINKDLGELEKAMDIAQKLQNLGAQERQQAIGIIQDIEQMQNNS